MSRLLALRIALLACLVFPPLARGQSPAAENAGESAAADADQGASTDARENEKGPRPPELLAFVVAGYPEPLPEMTDTVSVLLSVTIGEDGFVEDVALSGEPAGRGFDELAISAARRFVFEPARVDGKPIRSRIQYRYDFPKPQPPEPVLGALALRLLSLADDSPIPGAEISLALSGDPETQETLTTDETGSAAADALPPGLYSLEVRAEGFETRSYEEQIVEDQAADLTYRLKPEGAAQQESPDDLEYSATARVEAPPREVTRRTIEREVLTRVAGTRGDALRTIELLPGVSRPPFSSGQVLIRGSAPADSQVLLDGVPVPILYHFGGLTSFINSLALERIDFYPGNFSARYGRQIGGIIDVGLRDPQSDAIHGVLDVNIPVDSSLLLEGPLGDKASFLVAGRRSYLGEILTATIPEGTVDAIAAPVYRDYQGILSYRPTPRDRLRLSAYGSGDRLKVLFANVPDDDPTIQGIEIRSDFHRQQLGWRHDYSARLHHDFQASYGRVRNEFSAGRAIRFALTNDNTYLRAEWTYRASPAVQVMVGTDSQINSVEVSYRGPRPPQQEGGRDGATTGARDVVQVAETYNNVLPAGYLEVALEPTDKLRIVPGLRLDYFRVIHKFAFNPRLSASYAITPSTRLKGGIGVFSQAPRPEQTALFIGNRNLLPIKSVHYGLGVDQSFSHDLSLGVEGFYKDIYDRVVNGELGEPSFVNDGTGRVYGLEVAGRKAATGRWFGFLSYTLMRSERRDHGGPVRLFDYDQTHIFTLAGTVILGRGWEASATARFISGNPRTPVKRLAVYDEATDTYTPVYGPSNSVRSPPFKRLDLRVEKRWTFDRWALVWYVDVQNATNARNIEDLTYNFNYKERSQVRGLPIIPSLGLRGEL